MFYKNVYFLYENMLRLHIFVVTLDQVQTYVCTYERFFENACFLYFF